MNFKPTKYEIEIANARDIVASSLCYAGADKSVFEVLHALSVKSALARESAGFTTDIYEFMDGIFGASVILCGGVGCCISTKNNTGGFWEFDISCLEILIFELIRTACLNTKNVILTAKVAFGSLIVTASMDTGEYDMGLIKQITTKLGGRVQIVFHHSLKTAAVYVTLKKGSKKKFTTTKNSLEYICDPYSSAYIGLFDVCNNPLLMPDEE
ncbi:MAG: hypothetical protein PHV07_04990 [Oscillospiraceae bacterium]|nr:hypothetical protein [Oscillospiraceae bacterium]